MDPRSMRSVRRLRDSLQHYPEGHHVPRRPAAMIRGGLPARPRDRELVPVEHQRVDLASLAIVLPPDDRHTLAPVGLQALIGAKVALLERVPVVVVLPAHDRHASVPVLSELPVWAEVALFDRLPAPAV